jgi:hypothetical protein
MSQASQKKSVGFYFLLLAAAVALAAGVYFIVIHGTFGLDSTHNGDCFHPLIAGLLIGGAAAALVLALLKKYGLAAAAATAASGAALCLFIHKCYWYVVDVFVGIDEKHGFDPRFITFAALLLAAIVVGEIAIYTRKVREN